MTSRYHLAGLSNKPEEGLDNRKWDNCVTDDDDDDEVTIVYYLKASHLSSVYAKVILVFF